MLQNESNVAFWGRFGVVGQLPVVSHHSSHAAIGKIQQVIELLRENKRLKRAAQLFKGPYWVYFAGPKVMDDAAAWDRTEDMAYGCILRFGGVCQRLLAVASSIA